MPNVWLGEIAVTMNSNVNNPERCGQRPGVCEFCGYVVKPEEDNVAVVGSWDFAHERCVEKREQND